MTHFQIYLIFVVQAGLQIRRWVPMECVVIVSRAAAKALVSFLTALGLEHQISL